MYSTYSNSFYCTRWRWYSKIPNCDYIYNSVSALEEKAVNNEKSSKNCPYLHKLWEEKKFTKSLNRLVW